MIVFHVSEEPGLDVFGPRKVEATGESLVWAIDDEHLRNYLVPRECPRVTFYAGPGTSSADRERFLGSSRAVVRSRRHGSIACAPAGCSVTAFLATRSGVLTRPPATS